MGENTESAERGSGISRLISDCSLERQISRSPEYWTDATSYMDPCAVPAEPSDWFSSDRLRPAPTTARQVRRGSLDAHAAPTTRHYVPLAIKAIKITREGLDMNPYEPPS